MNIEKMWNKLCIDCPISNKEGSTESRVSGNIKISWTWKQSTYFGALKNMRRKAQELMDAEWLWAEKNSEWAVWKKCPDINWLERIN